MLALLAVTKSLVQETSTVLLTTGAPIWAIARQFQTEITFTAVNWIQPLPASQETVRGPYPSNTYLAEIDEMDPKVYDAAMGQAMAKPNARGMCRDKGLPVRTWCSQEVLKTESNPSG